jgi:hypothetical protein
MAASPADVRAGEWGWRMHVVLPTCRPCGNVLPMTRLALQLPGAELPARVGLPIGVWR